MKAFNVDDATLTSQLMTLYRKIVIASEKIINYRATSLSNYCCQISFIVRERPRISVIIHVFLFLRRYSKIFKFLKPVFSYACILTSLYHIGKNIFACLFSVHNAISLSCHEQVCL